MLNDCKTAEERFGGVSKIIDRWLEERQQLVKLFCQLTGVHPSAARPVWQSLQTFCDLLVDYASMGHFEVYEQLMLEGKEFADGSDQKVSGLIPQLEENTQKIMAFHDFLNERCDLHELADRATRLGEILETRFAMEDEMLEVLHYAHSPEKSLG